MSEPHAQRLSVPADDQAVTRACAFVGAFAAAARLAADESGRVLIAVEEIVSNIVKYGYAGAAQPGSIEIALRLDGENLTIEIVDDGRAFDPFAQPPPELGGDVEDRSVGGLGIHLARSLMDHAEYRRDGARNIVVVARKVTGGSANTSARR